MQKNYGRNFDRARPGFLSGQGMAKVLSLRNANLDRNQVITIAPLAAGGTGVANYTVVPAIYGKTTSQTALSLSYTASHSLATLVKDISAGLNNDSDFFNVAYAATSSTAIALLGRQDMEDWAASVSVLSSGTAAATFALATTASNRSAPIGFGLLVAQDPTTPDNVAHLPNSTNSKVVGVTLSTYAIEKDSIGPDAKTAYHTSETMDVIAHTLSNEGINCRAIEPDISRTDVVYSSFAAATAGYATKSPVNATRAYGAKFRASSFTTNAGENVVLVSVADN